MSSPSPRFLSAAAGPLPVAPSGQPVIGSSVPLSSVPPDEKALEDLTIFLPEQFIVAYHIHPHTLLYCLKSQESKDRGGEDRFICNICRAVKDRPSYSCALDAFDVCHTCAGDMEKEAIKLKAEELKLEGPDDEESDDVPVRVVESPSAEQRQPWYLGTVVMSFSGGGIRSASFCAGALQRFIYSTGVAPRLISSVSGGGYLAGAFIHWARAHHLGGVRLSDWVKSFFHHFHQHAGYLVRDAAIDRLGSCGDCGRLLLTIGLLITSTLLLALPAIASYAVLLDHHLGYALQASTSINDIWIVPSAFFGAAIAVAFLGWLATELKDYVIAAVAAAAQRHCTSAQWIRLTRIYREHQDNAVLRLSALLVVILAIPLLLFMLIVFSKIPLGDFGVWWSVLMLASLIMKSSHRVGWIILMLAAWQVYWYATVLTWYSNRESYRQPIRMPSSGHPWEYRSWRGPLPNSLWDLWASDWWGSGEMIIQMALIVSGFNNFIIVFRDMVLPYYYKARLTEAFYYKPNKCNCAGEDEGCRVFDDTLHPQLDQEVMNWYTRYHNIPLYKRWLRHAAEYGTVVTILESFFWLGRRLRRTLCWALRILMRMGYSVVLERRRQRWEDWCRHKLTLMQSWDVHHHFPNKRLTSLTDWICVTTLNEHRQFEHTEYSPIFDQFFLLTAKAQPPAGQPIVGLPLSGFGQAREMWMEARREKRHREDVLEKIMGPMGEVCRAELRAPPFGGGAWSLTAELGLNDSTALSGAALAFGMGRFTDSITVVKGVRGLHSLFGLSLNKQVLAIPFMDILLFWGGLFPSMLNFVHVLVLWGMAFSLFASNRHWLPFMCSGLAVVSALQVIVVTCWWSDGVELVPMYRAVRLLLGLPRIARTKSSAAPVAQLNLTDGGHSENFGILPLLSRQEELIVMCDGSADPKERMDEMYTVLSACRQVWDIRFQVMRTGLDELQLRPDYDDWNLKVDLKAWGKDAAANHSEEYREHVLRIHITYPHTGKVGLLLYLKPRKYNNELHRTHHLHGCCCACCHKTQMAIVNKLGGFIALGGWFPHHGTGNQFFTREMHYWYAREGQLAWYEANHWLRAWQGLQLRRTLLNRQHLQETPWFGSSEAFGAERNDLNRVDPMARLSRLSLFYIEGATNDRMMICGVGAGYRTGAIEEPYSHGICTQAELDDTDLGGGRLREVTRILNNDEYWITVEVKSGAFIDDLRFSGAAPGLDLGFCRNMVPAAPPPPYVDEGNLMHNAVTLPGLRLHRIRSRKEHGGACPILRLQFIFAQLPPVAAPPPPPPPHVPPPPPPQSSPQTTRRRGGRR